MKAVASTPSRIPRRSRKQVLELDRVRNSPIVIGQFGGGTGSNAGDAAVISLRHSRRLAAIDLGQSSQAKSTRSFTQAERKNAEDLDSDESDWSSDDDAAAAHGAREVVQVTHAHADHIGEPAHRRSFERVFHGQMSKDPKLLADARKLHKLERNNQPLFVWRQKERSPQGRLSGRKKRKAKPSQEGMSIRATAIVPTEIKIAKDVKAQRGKKRKRVDENEFSMGALIEVDKGDARQFSMLTLGDMDGDNGAEAIEEVLRSRGYLGRRGQRKEQQLDVVKVPHHGSENNIDLVPDEAIGSGTNLVLSGYTMTDAGKLIAKIRRTNPRSVHVLFQTSDLAKEFRESVSSLANLTWSPDGDSSDDGSAPLRAADDSSEMSDLVSDDESSNEEDNAAPASKRPADDSDEMSDLASDDDVDDESSSGDDADDDDDDDDDDTGDESSDDDDDDDDDTGDESSDDDGSPPPAKRRKIEASGDRAHVAVARDLFIAVDGKSESRFEIFTANWATR